MLTKSDFHFYGRVRKIMVSTVIVNPSPWQFLGSMVCENKNIPLSTGGLRYLLEQDLGSLPLLYVGNALWYCVHSSEVLVGACVIRSEWTFLQSPDGGLPCQVAFTLTWSMKSPEWPELSSYWLLCSLSFKWKLLAPLYMGFLGLQTISTSLHAVFLCLFQCNIPTTSPESSKPCGP